MNGSNPNQPKNPPKNRPSKKPGFRPPNLGKRRRAGQSGTPWILIGTLFVVYALMGLLMSIPQPPFWVWITGLIATPMMVLGCNRPVQFGQKRDFGWILAYLGALLMVVTLAVCANYIGNEQDLETIRFFTAVFALAGFTLAVIILTVVAAIVSAMAGSRLMSSGGYGRSMMVLLSTCFFGICMGGVIGLAVTTLSEQPSP